MGSMSIASRAQGKRLGREISLARRIELRRRMKWSDTDTSFIRSQISSRNRALQSKLTIHDEGIPTSLPSSVDDIAGRVDVQHKPDDLRTGPITRARAKLLEQQVDSLLTEYNLFTNENFVLPKSLHVCMIRFVAEASMTRGGEELHEDNRKMVSIISESMREERKAGAPPLKKKS
jgi:hypothetical protein